MGQSIRFRASGEQTVRSVMAALARRGYGLTRSFDLQTVCARHPEGCACPHHGTARCTCQYIVALVYPPGPVRAGLMVAPYTLTAHTYEHTTLVTVHSDQGGASEDRLIVMAAVMEAAGEMLADPCADEPEPCLPALTEM